MSVRLETILVPFLWLLAAPVYALETDQFYAWGKPIEDSTRYLNAWTRLQVESALETQAANPEFGCEDAVKQVQKRLQHSIYQPIETWIFTSDLVDKIPSGLEENRHYRQHYLLAKTFPLDYARWLQPSPTLEVDGIRMGSDKLAHFFSEGWWYYRKWKNKRHKMTPEEMHHELVQYGVDLEKWVQGMTLTGVLSPADMEANYQGFAFYHGMCHGDEPMLSRQGGRWHFSESFDFRNYVSPEWDESWNPNIYGRQRWKGIRSTMAGYCPLLNSTWVKQQRERYRGLDTQTPTENLISEQVATGELPDPRDFDITAVCETVRIKKPSQVSAPIPP